MTTKDNIREDMKNLSRENLELLAYEIFDGYSRIVIAYRRMEGVVNGMIAFFASGVFGKDGEEVTEKLQSILRSNEGTLGEMTQAMFKKMDEED